MKRKILLISGLVLIIAVAVYNQLIYYGLSQAKGQFNVIWNAKPISEILSDPSFPDSLKERIHLVQEIRQYAFDSLGINHSDNYTSVFDQKGKPILWVLTASDPYKLEAMEWKFPLIGSFSYKGFFDYEKGVKELNRLKDEGYDVSLDEVEGWSTLGWFKDPILSNMLGRSPGSLSNLIIHELTHGTLYVKNNVDYNENLASFVGDKGALKFLGHKYGTDSKEYHQYEEGKKILEQYTSEVLRNGNKLDSLYNTFTDEMNVEEKQRLKEQVMQEIMDDLQQYFDYFKEKNPKYYRKIKNLNNTYFLDYRRYRKDLKEFEDEFVNDFNSDFRAYFSYLKEKYPSL